MKKITYKQLQSTFSDYEIALFVWATVAQYCDMDTLPKVSHIARALGSSKPTADKVLDKLECAGIIRRHRWANYDIFEALQPNDSVIKDARLAYDRVMLYLWGVHNG